MKVGSATEIKQPIFKSILVSNIALIGVGEASLEENRYEGKSGV
jgi:hypothetical protein